MKKEITICDLCGKEIEDKLDIRHTSVLYRCSTFETCPECALVIRKCEDEVKMLNKEYNKKIDEIEIKYGMPNKFRSREEGEDQC